MFVSWKELFVITHFSRLVIFILHKLHFSHGIFHNMHLCEEWSKTVFHVPAKKSKGEIGIQRLTAMTLVACGALLERCLCHKCIQSIPNCPLYDSWYELLVPSSNLEMLVLLVCTPDDQVPMTMEQPILIPARGTAFLFLFFVFLFSSDPPHLSSCSTDEGGRSVSPARNSRAGSMCSGPGLLQQGGQFSECGESGRDHEGDHDEGKSMGSFSHSGPRKQRRRRRVGPSSHVQLTFLLSHWLKFPTNIEACERI